MKMVGYFNRLPKNLNDLCKDEILLELARTGVIKAQHLNKIYDFYWHNKRVRLLDVSYNGIKCREVEHDYVYVNIE